MLVNNEVIIEKYYLFGLINVMRTYNLVDEERTIRRVFQDIPKDSKTFSLESLNKVSNSNIIFYK